MILVCGEALMDLFLGAAQGASIPATAVAGGSPFNVATGLARLGCRAGFFGGLSKDHFGRHLEALLQAEGVALDLAPRLQELTTLSVVATGSDGSPRYAFHGEGAADRALQQRHLPPSLEDEVTALTFGSYSIAVESCGSTYLALAERERGRRVISLDPNVRPTIIGDMVAWRARFDAFLATATLVKASDEDIALAYGADADVAAVARQWLGAGPSLVVVTLGAKGATAFHRDVRVDRPGHRVEVVDTVGAGDTFHAALLARLEQRGRLSQASLSALDSRDLGDLVDYAIAASAITCTRRGADLPRAHEVDAQSSEGPRR